MPRNFLSGELDKTLYPQVDQSFYQSGLEDSQGFIITPEGVATLCPGTIYVANTKNNVKVRLEKFIFSEDDVYALEFGPLYIRFYRDDGQLGAPTEVATTYTADEIFELDVKVQLADTLYIFHSAHQRAKLVRSGNTSWAISDLAMTDGPFRDQNTSATTLAASAVTGSGVDLVASTATFQSGHVNAIFEINHDVSEAEASGAFNSISNGTSVFVQRDNAWNIVVIPDSTWNGTITLQFSSDNATFTTEQTITQSTSRERQVRNGIATEDIYVRVICTARTAGTAAHFVYADAYTHKGIAKITSVTDTTNAVCEVLTDLISTNATTLWSEGSWSTYRGFPVAGYFYANRICTISNSAEPQQTWLSVQNDFESHREGVNATDAFQQPLDGARPSPVRWVDVSDKGILVGTLGQVLSYFPQDSTLSARPTNPFTKRASVAHSSGFVRPLEAGSSFLMPQLGGTAIMELLFSTEEGTLLAPDLTRYVKHLVRVDDSNGIVDIDFQRRPYPILWCVRSDGVLLAFLYDRTLSVAAWTKAQFTGTYESVTVLPKGTYDQVWLSSLHTVNGSEVRFVSRMDQLDIRKPLKDMVFVEAGLHWRGGSASVVDISQASNGVVSLDEWPQDSDGVDMVDGKNVRLTGVVGPTELNGKVFDVANADSVAKTLTLRLDGVDIDTTQYDAYVSGGSLEWVENSFGGINHWEGETLTITTDGISSEQATVSSGAITLSDSYNSASAGKFSTARLIPLPLELGRSLGKQKHVSGALLGAYRSVGGRYGPLDRNGDINKPRNIDWAKAQEVHDWETSSFTGILRLTDDWIDERSRIAVEQTEPISFTITMIEPEVS